MLNDVHIARDFHGCRGDRHATRDKHVLVRAHVDDARVQHDDGHDDVRHDVHHDVHHGIHRGARHGVRRDVHHDVRRGVRHDGYDWLHGLGVDGGLAQ